MKSFKQYISEEIQTPTTHVISGPYVDHEMTPEFRRDATEHSYHATIPSANGETNLWISHIEVKRDPLVSKDLLRDELHFSVSDSVTPEVFHETRERMIQNGNHEQAATPSQVFYSIPNEKQSQLSTSFHGPGTMFHVMHHMREVIRRLPSGRKVSIEAADEDPTEAQRKAKAYHAIIERWAREGIIKNHSLHASGALFERA